MHTHPPFTGTQMPLRGSRQTLTLLAIRILMHLPRQDALLVGGHRGVLDQLEEGVAHLASQGRRPGLLGPGCVFFIPGHQRIRLGVLTGQRPSGGAHHHLRTPTLSLSCWAATPQDPPPPKKSSSKGNPSLPIIPTPSPPLAPPGVPWPTTPSSETGPLPRLRLHPHRGEHCPGARVLQLRWVGGGRAGEREGRKDGSHLHGPLELLTSDRPVEGLEQKHTGGPGSLGPWGAHSVWQR